MRVQKWGTSMSRIPPIISVDDHVVEPPHLWQTWLPAKWRERGPKVVSAGYSFERVNGRRVETMTGTGPEVDWWVYEESLKLLPIQSHFAGRDRQTATDQPLRFAELRPGYYDPKARLADMDLNHTERSLCFPNLLPRFAGQTFLEAKDKELALACVMAYNDFIVEEWCGDSGGRLIPLGVVPLWDPALAAGEVRRNAARGCRAITFTELPANLGLPSLHDRNRHWDPLFAACAETGTVICMHVGSGTTLLTTAPDAPTGMFAALINLNAMMSLTDWLLSGVLMRFPALKIAYSESQIGWMPYMFERIDNVFVKARGWGGFDPALTDLPTTQIAGRVYGCFFEDDFGLAVRDAVGIDQITFEVDYPHQDTTWPDSVAYLEKITTGLSDDEVHKVVRGNAIRMLDLPAELPGS
jgi:predicted TIM-barrel fold metal-dependent hydrolase